MEAAVHGGMATEEVAGEGEGALLPVCLWALLPQAHTPVDEHEEVETLGHDGNGTLWGCLWNDAHKEVYGMQHDTLLWGGRSVGAAAARCPATLNGTTDVVFTRQFGHAYLATSLWM